mgnify:CR=1 FL=1
MDFQFPLWDTYLSFCSTSNFKCTFNSLYGIPTYALADKFENIIFQFPLWDTTMGVNTLPLYIGIYQKNAFPFNGLISRILIYSRALSQTEIQWNYNNPFQFPLWDTIPNT